MVAGEGVRTGQKFRRKERQKMAIERGVGDRGRGVNDEEGKAR